MSLMNFRFRHVYRHALLVLASLLSLGLIVSSIAALPAAAEEQEHGIEVVVLEVENRTEPQGIDVEKPRFSWITSSDARDVQQTSYRVRVATTEAQLDSSDIWDSGVVNSAESTGIEYGGDNLQPADTYFWRVDVTTSAGDGSAQSTFGTGLFAEEDWADSAWIGRERVDSESSLTFENAKWIWTPEDGAPVAPAEDRAFRKTIDSPEGKTAASAEIIITADDSYKLWMNGELLGQTEGADNEWQGSKKFTVDLAAASNTIAVRTTNGPGSPAGLLMVVKVTYSDGSSETHTTDETWEAVKEIPEGFEATDFDDSAWPEAAVQATYGSGPWGNGVNLPSDPPAAAPLLRKEFWIDGEISSAKIYVAAGGYANVSLNGAPINDEIMSPGFTDYDDHAQYTVTDVTEQLQAGVNALGMELGRGFYGMTNGNVWNWQNAPWHDEPVARAVLRIEHSDGTVANVITDESWTLQDGPTLLDDLYGGETFDASKVQPGFDTPGFEDTGWVAASEVNGPKGQLINQAQQPIRVTENLPAESITEPEPGAYVVKFPRVLAGNVRFTVQGEAGTTIRAQYGEKLLENGRPNFSNNGGFQNGFQTDRFILAGTGEPETWAAKFSYKGFQYIEVTGWPEEEAPPLSAFTAEVLHTDAPETGSFESSNAIMNQTHRAVVDTLLNNIHSIPTDTPMFEKNGWTGDAAVGAEMFMMNLDVQNLFAKWMGDINDTRDENGAPLVIAPSSGDWGQWGVNPSWHAAYILIPWWLYQYGGDSRPLEQYYDGMKTYVDVEFERSPGGIATARLGDWVSPEASPAGGNAPEDVRVSATAYLYTMLTSMEKSAEFLGKPDDAAAFAAKAATVKDAFNESFYDAELGHYRGISGDNGYRQTHNVLALAFDLAPDEETAQRVADSLAADVTVKGNKLNTGTLGTKDLLPMLTKYGYGGLAVKVAAQTEYPSWGYMIENGATTMWEHWSLEARSRGHYFLGTVDDWFYHDVAGINSSELTGYRDITIKPAVTDQLDWAKATTETPFGPVSVDWKNDGDRLVLATHVPVGSTATVHFPADNSWAVTEGGRFLDSVDGVLGVEQEDDNVLVTIGSGDYSFEVDPATAGVGTVLDLIEELQAEVDLQRNEGELTEKDHTKLTRLMDRTRETTHRALVAVSEGDGAGAARQLVGALRGVDNIDRRIDKLKVSAPVIDILGQKADALRQGIETMITVLIGVEVNVASDQPSYLPGETGTLTAKVTNGAGMPIQNVTAMLTGLGNAWEPTPGDETVARVLLAGGSKSADLGFTVPADQDPRDVSAVVSYSYRFFGAIVRIAEPVTIGVRSTISITDVGLDPADVAPGESSNLTATVRNSGTQQVSGRLDMVVPDGWEAPAATSDVVIPAGGEVTLSVLVPVPVGANQAQQDLELTANFVRSGVLLGSGTATLSVSLAPIPDPLTGYDHVDLGVATDEQAHRLTASASSGTSTEAGLTRRYAGHLTDFSYFEFDMNVAPGQPFLIRATETYDRAQTKRYKVYVDGVEVTERIFSHTDGASTQTYEFLVDGALAVGDTVRIKVETQDDHTYYDPSIADVWTLPLTDNS